MNCLKPFATFAFFIQLTTTVQAQYEGCPNSLSDNVAHLAFSVKDPTSGLEVTALQPNTSYRLEIYETPMNSTAPNYVQYNSIGIQGAVVGFKLYQNLATAQQFEERNYDEETLKKGVSKNVGLNGVSVWGIRTASNTISSKLTISIDARAQCNSSTPGSPVKFFKKKLELTFN